MSALSYRHGMWEAGCDLTWLISYSIAHRLREMQTLPYVVITNPHMSHVYQRYLNALERFASVTEIKTLDDNAVYCNLLQRTLTEHLTVIPRLIMGFLECSHLLRAETADKMMNALLKSVRHLCKLSAFTTDTLAANIASSYC